MREVVKQISRVRSRARMMLVALRLSVLGASVLCIAFVLALADFVFRFPGAVRLVIDALVVVGLLWVLARWVLPAILFRPSLTDIALRIESHVPSLRGHLASGVEFSEDGSESTSALAREAVAEARRRVGRASIAQVIDSHRAAWGGSGLALALVMAVALSLVWPTSAGVAARRWLDPLGDVRWPARTDVQSAMATSVHARGVSLSLRARVERGLEPGMRIYAHYRILDGDDWRPWESVILTAQRDGYFERLVDTEGDALEVWFESDDDATDVERIAVVEPPRIQSAHLTLEPPDYARLALGTPSVDLGPGTDERSILETPALVGTVAHLTLMLNKPLSVTGQDLERAWLDMLGLEQGTEASSDMQFTAALQGDVDSPKQASDQWEFEWVLTETARLNPVLVDEYGLTGPEDVYYRLDVRQDAEPSVAILDPPADQSCLVSAYVDVSAEARDDVRVGELAIETATNVDARGGFGTDAPWTIVTQRGGDDVVMQLSTTLDIATLGVVPGDVLSVRASATDTYAYNGQQHEPVHSAPRLIRIISEAQFVEQLYQNLSAVRESAIRIEQQQGELSNRLDESPARVGDVRDQARISQQIARQGESLAQLEERLRANRMEDPALDSLIEEAQSLLNEAGRASDASGESLARASDLSDTSDPEAEQQKARQAQEDVSDRLAEVIELLDEGRDAWVMRREVERLLEAQSDLKSRSENITNTMRGKNPQELSQAERSALESLASEQEDLARQANELIEELRQRADQVEEQDADLAEAMRQAASQAQQEGLEEQMQQASEQLNQNQGERASGSQSQAMQTLGQMLEGLESVEKAKVQRLGRALADLVQSIESLIDQQEAELAAYFEARGEYSLLSQGMFRLNTNTYAVLDVARKAGREVMTVAGHLESAARAQDEVLESLAQGTINGESILHGEQRSLEALRDALEEAKKLQEQIQNQEARQKRQELMRAYRALYERQLTVSAETASLDGQGALDRRGRIRAQQLGREQTTIRSDAADLLTSMAEIAESIVYKSSHDQIDALSDVISSDLLKGEVGPLVQMRQGDVADRFAGLALALEESVSNDEFAAPGAGSGGSGGGGQGSGEQPLIPPAAQLKLLRSLQESVYRSTRSLDESGERLAPNAHGERMNEIGSAQAQIADLAQELINELMNPQTNEGVGP